MLENQICPTNELLVEFEYVQIIFIHGQFMVKTYSLDYQKLFQTLAEALDKANELNEILIENTASIQLLRTAGCWIEFKANQLLYENDRIDTRPVHAVMKLSSSELSTKDIVKELINGMCDWSSRIKPKDIDKLISRETKRLTLPSFNSHQEAITHFTPYLKLIELYRGPLSPFSLCPNQAIYRTNDGYRLVSCSPVSYEDNIYTIGDSVYSIILSPIEHYDSLNHLVRTKAMLELLCYRCPEINVTYEPSNNGTSYTNYHLSVQKPIEIYPDFNLLPNIDYVLNFI